MMQTFVITLKITSLIPLGRSKNLHNYGTNITILAEHLGTAVLTEIQPFFSKGHRLDSKIQHVQKTIAFDI